MDAREKFVLIHPLPIFLKFFWHIFDPQVVVDTPPPKYHALYLNFQRKKKMYFCYHCTLFYTGTSNRDIGQQCPICDGTVTRKLYVSGINLDEEIVNSYVRNQKKKFICGLLTTGYCPFPHNYNRSETLSKGKCIITSCPKLPTTPDLWLRMYFCVIWEDERFREVSHRIGVVGDTSKISRLKKFCWLTDTPKTDGVLYSLDPFNQQMVIYLQWYKIYFKGLPKVIN